MRHRCAVCKDVYNFAVPVGRWAGIRRKDALLWQAFRPRVTGWPTSACDFFVLFFFFFGVKDVWVEVVGHLYLETYISYLCIPPFAPFLKSDADRQLFLMDGDTRGWQLFLRLLLSLFHVLDAFEKKKTKATPSKCSTSESPPSSLSLFHIQSIIRSSCCRYAL